MTERRVDISITIPYFERQAELEALLAGLDRVERDALQVETLVVEDGSSVAHKAELQQKHAALNLVFVTNDRNMGPGYSRNRGVRESRGRYLWFLDSDAQVVDPRVLRALMKALRDKPSRLAVGGTLEEVEGVPHIMRPVVLPALHFLYERHPLQPDYREKVECLSTANFFMDRRAFLAAGGFDVGLRMYEDNELCLRLQEIVGGEFYQETCTLMLHNVSPRGRDAGFFDYFTDRSRYMKVKLTTRNILLRRYKRWRLLVLPALEAVSIATFLAGLRSGRWHLSRLAAARGGSWWYDMALLALYNVYAVGLFFRPSGHAARRNS